MRLWLGRNKLIVWHFVCDCDCNALKVRCVCKNGAKFRSTHSGKPQKVNLFMDRPSSGRKPRSLAAVEPLRTMYRRPAGQNIIGRYTVEHVTRHLPPGHLPLG